MITTDGTLFELRGPGLYNMGALPDIALETFGAESTVEYAYAATNVQSRSVRKSEIIPNIFKQAMALPAKLEWKAVSEKEVESLKRITSTRFCQRPMFPPDTRSSTHARDESLCSGWDLETTLVPYDLQKLQKKSADKKAFSMAVSKLL